MTRAIVVSLCAFLVPTGSALAQTMQTDAHAHETIPCVDSPTPGKRPVNIGCAILERKQFSSLPPGPVVWRFETFAKTEAAQLAATASSVVVEAAGKVWLLTLGTKGERSPGAKFITEVGPLSISSAPKYEIVAGEAYFGPDVDIRVHTHSGPETLYVISGEHCVELPDRTMRARAGQGMFVPADTPMKLTIIGPSKRDALFLVVHDPAREWNTWSDWQPKGFCKQ